MKICVTSQGNTLGSDVDARFGRCKYFIFVDTDTLEFEAVSNSNIDVSSGAGTQAGQTVADKDVKAVLSGDIGPKAFRVLQSAGIDIYIGIDGKVKDAVENFKQGKYKPKGTAGI
ncbi:NifB/NifX family molybdenum-iron cluster-binding protein [Elusimicrobiota bacterium]